MPDYDLALQEGKDGTVLVMKRREETAAHNVPTLIDSE